jgi:undecaprenyl-diphosphatase
MISVAEACVLGAVQGVTEFLPVSSSGHLAMVHSVVTPLPGAQVAAVDVVLHVGTLAAVVAYFRDDLAQLTRGLLGYGSGWQRGWVWLLILGTLPALIVGGLFRTRLEASFHSLGLVGVNFLITGTLLWVAGRSRRGGRDEASLGPRDALIIGCFQAAALLPGISRSGSTVSAGLLRGLDDEVAARFAFLLGIPAIVGAQVSELSTVLSLGSDAVLPLAAGTFVAGAVGFVAIAGFMRLLQAGRLHYFAYYLWPLGIVGLAASLSRGT